jgi:hypothetical protein
MSKLLIEDRERAIDYILGNIWIKSEKEEVIILFKETSNLPINKSDFSITNNTTKLKEFIYYLTTLSVESVIASYPAFQKRIKKEFLYDDIKASIRKNLCN